MGQLWYKQDDEIWVPGYPYARVDSGWLTGKILYLKTGPSTWTNVWQKDQTPPGPPDATTFTYDSSTRKITATFHASVASDVVRGILKVSTSGYATSPTSTSDGAYNGAIQSDGYAWSDFPIGPSGVITRTTSALAANTTYYFTAWVQDSSYNWSERRLDSYKTAAAIVTPPTVVNKSVSWYATDAGSWAGTSNYWRTDNNYVYQGGLNWYGLWFYAGAPSAALYYAKTISKITIKMTRVNTAHGVAGPADVWLMPHKLSTQPSGSPESYCLPASKVKVGSISRGETKTFNVPTAWWPYFKSKTYKGVGLYYGNTQFTDVEYLYTYGNAVFHAEWTQ